MELQTDRKGWKIVPVLACVLNQLCRRNDKRRVDSRYYTQFHALHPPAVSIRDYLVRIAKYAGCSGECFVLALIYIDRIIKGNTNFAVNSLNVHRLLVVSVMLGAKFFDDQYYNNSYYAQIGGVTCEEINTLEVEFLFMINFNLFVRADTFHQYYNELTSHMKSDCSSCLSTSSDIEKMIQSTATDERTESRKKAKTQEGSAAPAKQNDGVAIPQPNVHAV